MSWTVDSPGRLRLQLLRSWLDLMTLARDDSSALQSLQISNRFYDEAA